MLEESDKKGTIVVSGLSFWGRFGVSITSSHLYCKIPEAVGKSKVHLKGFKGLADNWYLNPAVVNCN